MTPPICPYCNIPAELKKVIGGTDHKKRYARLKWMCIPCDASVGCHPFTDKPLGTLADKHTRFWRRKAHATFDPLWKAKTDREDVTPFYARRLGYAWLANELGVTVDKCHIAMFKARMCKRVVAICEKYYKKVKS